MYGFSPWAGQNETQGSTSYLHHMEKLLLAGTALLRAVSARSQAVAERLVIGRVAAKASTYLRVAFHAWAYVAIVDAVVPGDREVHAAVSKVGQKRMRAVLHCWRLLSMLE